MVSTTADGEEKEQHWRRGGDGQARMRWRNEGKGGDGRLGGTQWQMGITAAG